MQTNHLSVYRLCTLQPSTCSPLPLLLSGQSLALPPAEGLSVVPAHLNHREAQALPNTWTRSCRLRSRGSVEQRARRACWETCKKHWKTAHLSPKHSFYRQPPRSRLDGNKSRVKVIHKTATEIFTGVHTVHTHMKTDFIFVIWPICFFKSLIIQGKT